MNLEVFKRGKWAPFTQIAKGAEFLKRIGRNTENSVLSYLQEHRLEICEIN
jgi:hypothetical protein